MPHPPGANCYHHQVVDRVLFLYHEQGYTEQRIAETFGGKPCRKTVSRIICDHRAGRLAALRGRMGLHNVNRKFNAGAAAALIDIVTNKESMYLHEMASEMLVRTGEPWTEGHLSKCLAELGYVRKVCTKRSREATMEAQYAFRQVIEMFGIKKDQLVFGDEVSTVCSPVSPPLGSSYFWHV